jgi:hypothetical protein
MSFEAKVGSTGNAAVVQGCEQKNLAGCDMRHRLIAQGRVRMMYSLLQLKFRRSSPTKGALFHAYES